MQISHMLYPANVSFSGNIAFGAEENSISTAKE